MKGQPANPTPLEVLVDGQVWTDIVEVNVQEGHLFLVDTSGWVGTIAAGKWSQVSRKDPQS